MWIIFIGNTIEPTAVATEPDNVTPNVTQTVCKRIKVLNLFG